MYNWRVCKDYDGVPEILEEEKKLRDIKIFAYFLLRKKSFYDIKNSRIIINNREFKRILKLKKKDIFII